MAILAQPHLQANPPNSPWLRHRARHPVHTVARVSDGWAVRAVQWCGRITTVAWCATRDEAVAYVAAGGGYNG